MDIAENICITNTHNWIVRVVIGCNFCPFAAYEVKRQSIFYTVTNSTAISILKKDIAAMFTLLNKNAEIETAFLIFEEPNLTFKAYLQIVQIAEKIIKKAGYEGVYQIASFHPQYIFANSTDTDPTNYTNRSPYAMLHFLREKSVTKAVDKYADIESITKQNMAFTQHKGLQYMKQLLQSCR